MQLETNLSPLLSAGRAAELIGNHPKTLEKWRARGIGPKYLRLGGRIRYTAQAIQEYISSCVVDPTAAATARNRDRRRQQRTG